MSYIELAQDIARQFEYGKDDVRKATARFVEQMEEGLKNEGATMSQIPSYITSLPDGTDKGLYLAVDLGGTNLRVCAIDLHGDTTYSIKQSKVTIPPEMMVAATFSELFGFIATQLQLFLEKHHSKSLEALLATNPGTTTEKNKLLLGFTFSFAFEQEALDRGSLLRWTKGFDIPDAVGKDICAVLQSEIDERGLPVTVAALVNDTVGTLLARSYTSPGKSNTLLGAIFGTGTNGAYVEKLSEIAKLQSKHNSANDIMIVNTEWGSFDNEMKVLPDTKYDRALDDESLHPGIQMFEKRISGMYLGEILRHTILEVVSRQNTYFISERLQQKYAIDASFLSMAAGDKSTGLVVLRQQLKKHLELDAEESLAEAVKILAISIGRRAARLAGVAISGVILKSGRLAVPSTSSKQDSLPRQIVASRDVEDGVSDVASRKSSSSFWRSLRRILFSATSLFAFWRKLLFDHTNLGGNDTNIPELEKIDVGVDGSLYEFYPQFEEIIRSVLRDIELIGVEGEKRVQIGKAKDGSGVGAALAARAADKTRKID